MCVHFGHVLDAETGGENSYLHLLAKFRGERDTPLFLEVRAELLHEVVHLVHLLHHQATFVLCLTVVALLGKVDAEQNLLGVEHVVVVEKR